MVYVLSTGLQPQDKIYHKQRQQVGVFLHYDDLRSVIHDTCWIEIDGEELHVSCDQVLLSEGKQ